MMRRLRPHRLPATAATRVDRNAKRHFLSRSVPRRPVENLNVRRLSQEAHDHHRNRQTFLAAGALAGVISCSYTAYKLYEALNKPAQSDSNLPSTDLLSSSDAANRKIVVHDENGREIVLTGNAVVPSFPRTIDLPSFATPAGSELISTGTAKTEYTLVGLGLRTVTFMGFGVYLVGFYVATPDIARLQNALVKRINPIASTLVPDERDRLRTTLVHPSDGEKLWEELLDHDIPARSFFRIMPVRDTDFHHLRDGLVRAIQSRTSSVRGDDQFGQAVKAFRDLFNRGSMPKRQELLLLRENRGELAVVYGQGADVSGRELLGVVENEALSRALWLNYLAGKRVASEPARASIIEGIMEFVERPVGTVAAQVV